LIRLVLCGIHTIFIFHVKPYYVVNYTGCINAWKNFKYEFLITEQGNKFIQGGAEMTDTFKMVIDSIWKEEKIGETVYKYVQLCYLLPLITSLFSEHQADILRLHECIVASVSGSCRTRASVGPHQ